MLECYVGEKKDYWWIVTQVHAARMHGLLPKTIVALGLGKGGNPGEDWARTKEELEQQVRFVRLIAPELTAPVVISLTIERPRGVNQGPAGFVSLEYCRIKGEFIKEMLGALLPNVVFPGASDAMAVRPFRSSEDHQREPLWHDGQLRRSWRAC